MATYSNPFTVEKTEQKRVFFTQLYAPDVVKSDCKSGKFITLGGDKKTSPEQIEMQVLKYADLPNAILFPHGEGETLKKEPFMWTQIFFVDVRGVLCSTLLKNESRDNFLKAIRDCEVNSKGAKNYTDFVFVAAMADRKNKRKEDYFAIEFAPSEIAPEDYERNVEFSKLHHESIFCSRTMQEFVKWQLPDTKPENVPSTVAKLLYGFGFIGEDKFTELLPQTAIDSSAQLETA